MKLEIKHYFDSAHQLPDTEFLKTKACARLHGHTYKTIITFEGEKLEGGMVVDFKIIKEIVDELDHQFINEVFSRYELWKDISPSSENISKFIHWLIKNKLYFIKNLSVAVCEGYKGEERASYTIYEEK